MKNDRMLITPVLLGAIDLSHRVVVSAAAHLHADPGDRPGQLMLEYYSQHASTGGLTVTGATPVASLGKGYTGAPGIYDDQQTPGWKRIVDAVHTKGGRIVLQLWHGGRVSHADFTGGQRPVAPSEVPFRGQVFAENKWVAARSARALELEEIPTIIAEFRAATERAKSAGFDGVEINAADGYLLDQFLQDNANRRTDRYGGSIENRVRLLLEVTETVVSVMGSGRVGVRISPASQLNEMADSDPHSTFRHLAKELNRFGLAYLHIIEPHGNAPALAKGGLKAISTANLRQVFTGKIIATGTFEPANAEAIVLKGDADLIAFATKDSSFQVNAII